MPNWNADVGYVRSLRIRSLSIACEGKRLGGYGCDHCGQLDLAPYPDALSLKAIRRQLVCTACGAIGEAEVRPNWKELAQNPMYGPR